MMKKIIILLFPLLVSGFSVKANMDSLLTGIDNFKGLRLSEPPREFESNELFTMIDGGAEVYIEYGFKKALDVAYLLADSIRIGIQIYEMTDDAAAFGIFSSSRNISDSSLKIGDFASGNDYYLMVQKSNFFYIVSSAENTYKSYKNIINIASTVSSNINSHGTLPDLVKKSLMAGFKIEQIKYIRGKIALSGSYFFSHKDIFDCNNSICINEGTSKIFIFEFNDSLTSGKKLSSINQDMISSGRFSEFKSGNAGFKCLDRNLKPLDISVFKNYIVIISGEENKELIIQKIHKFD
jgi:hypothetical protein